MHPSPPAHFSKAQRIPLVLFTFIDQNTAYTEIMRRLGSKIIYDEIKSPTLIALSYVIAKVNP